MPHSADAMTDTLGCAAARPAGNAVGQRDEEVGDARAFQERAEDDEQHDVGVAHVHGSPDDARGGVEQLLHDLAQRSERVGTARRRDLPIERIACQAQHHNDDGQAHASAAQLHQDQDPHHAQHHVQRLDAGTHQQDVGAVRGRRT